MSLHSLMSELVSVQLHPTTIKKLETSATLKRCSCTSSVAGKSKSLHFVCTCFGVTAPFQAFQLEGNFRHHLNITEILLGVDDHLAESSSSTCFRMVRLMI